MNRIKATKWLLIGVPVIVAFSCLLLSFVFYDSNPALSAADVTVTPRRPDLAPPATRVGVIQATPNFATFVPLPLTANFDPQQLAMGRRTYTQWCATCHGDRGQGLAEWRFSWDAEHQDCTKSGCHGTRHAEGGFTMFKIAPPLIGPDTLKTFQNAAQLYFFIHAAMPYQAPGTLGDDEYWALTAFLADQHHADAQGNILDATTAPAVLLNPPGAANGPDQPSTPAQP